MWITMGAGGEVSFSESDLVYLTFSYSFNAFHRMWNEALPADENLELFGKCANPAGHGHRYRLSVTVARVCRHNDPFVMMPGEIEEVKKKVLAPVLESANLNQAFGGELVASSENLIREIWILLRECFGNRMRLVRLELQETEKNTFAYFGA